MDKKKGHEELSLEAKNFFDAYKKELGESIRANERIVKIEFSSLSEFSPMLSDKIVESPGDTLAVMENALEELMDIKNPRIRFTNLPKTANLKIREIRAKHLDKFIWIEGIVRTASDVRPQVVNAKFECPNCGAILSVLQIEQKFREPSRCSCSWKGQFRLLSKTMVDVQRLIIEESPDSLDGGEQPRRINVFLQEDLVDPKMEERTTPGSKIKILGTLKEVAIPLKTGSISTRYDIAVEANNIIPLEEASEDINISEEEVKQILELGADPNIQKRLSQSIAPSIYGFENIKEAVLLQLLGGVKKTKSDAGTTRGDIHILLVGDPGVAKSVMLKFVSTIAPKGRYVSGKAATGAGLTATVVKDEFLRGWALEAGALVLANKGTVCIDEIEKMNEQDRSTMHEAMEQQCYLPDFEIMLADGTKRKIGPFVDSLIEANEENVHEGINCEILPLREEFKILTTDFESIYPIKIDKVSRHVAPDKFVRVRLWNGREITVTPEHPCWIIENGMIRTASASNLKAGNFFPIPGELPIGGEEQLFNQEPYRNGPELCKILGYHISDGCYELNRGKKNGIQFWNNNPKLINDYKEAIKSVFDLNPGITRRRNQMAVRVVSRKVVDFFNNLDGNLMEKGILKKIPEQIMKCRKEDLAYLIRALFDGDGTIVNVKRGGCRVTLITENMPLAEQASEILLRFGIISSIFRDGAFFRVDISGQGNLLKYYQNVGFLSDKKQRRLENYLAKRKLYRSITDIVPNSSGAIRDIFVKLKIGQTTNLGNQIGIEGNKHRPMLQKMIKLVEEKIERIIASRQIVEKTISSRELGKIRKEIGLSILGTSKKLKMSNYMLEMNEKRDISNKKYRDVLLSEIDNMLSVLPVLRDIKKLAFGKIRWSEIKSVEIVPNPGIKWVYDVTIEPTNSFISNNMVLHNSISISKANIQATLRAETTVLAAGNPKLGRFDPYTPIPQQIDISPALLSRFDVIFIIKDLPNKVQDEAIATHVLEEHKQGVIRDVIDPKLLKKYISYAKKNFKPKLSNDAIDEIKTFYVKLRNQSVKSDSAIKPISITARQLEGIIRLSEACAKARLSDEVIREDAKKAIELLKVVLMEVGYDEETKTFDIDRITTGITSSKRSKILLVREAIGQLESKIGKLIPMEELEKLLGDRINQIELDDAITQLSKSGDIFRPKKGFIQRT